MSAPLPSLLADKLDVSEKKAKKLLVAMLREVKKRAARKGVQLPEFGTFWVEDGQLTFDPDPSLARAVNQQFEGLESEDLDTAPIQTSPQEEEKSDEGPDTITLGYQDSQDSSSDWTPIDSEDEPAEEDEETDDAPDTAEFQVPSAEQAADTDELQAQEDDATDPEPEPRDPESEPREPEPEPREPEPEPREQAPDSHTTEEETEASPDPSSSATGPSSRDPDQSHTQTEELYPLVEEVSGSAGSEDDSSSPDQQVDDEERESLSGIWDEDDQAEAPEPSSEPDSESTPEPDSAAETEPEPAAQTEPEPTAAPEADPSAQTQPVIDPEPAAESSGAESPAEVSADADAQEVTAEDLEEEAAADGGSTGTRVLAGALVLLLLGGAGWYVLGQRGTVPSPRATFAQLQSQVKDLPLVGSTADTSPSGTDQQNTQATGTTPTPSGSESASDSQSPSSGGGDAQASETTADASSTTESSATESSTPAPSDETERASPRGLNPSAGGWTIIVASRTQRDPAESLVQNYRNIFAGQNLPIGILTGTVDGKTRYRIGIGQFSSRSEAQAFLKKAGDKLPQGAWMLSL